MPEVALVGEGGQQIGFAAHHDAVYLFPADREDRSHPGLEERPWLVALGEDAEEGVAVVGERQIPGRVLNALRQTDHRKRERDRFRMAAGGAVGHPQPGHPMLEGPGAGGAEAGVRECEGPETLKLGQPDGKPAFRLPVPAGPSRLQLGHGAYHRRKVAGEIVVAEVKGP